VQSTTLDVLEVRLRWAEQIQVWATYSNLPTPSGGNITSRVYQELSVYILSTAAAVLAVRACLPECYQLPPQCYQRPAVVLPATAAVLPATGRGATSYQPQCYLQRRIIYGKTQGQDPI